MWRFRERLKKFIGTAVDRFMSPTKRARALSKLPTPLPVDTERALGSVARGAKSSFMTIQHLRLARPTDRLQEVVAFYTALFEFEIVGSFEDHEGFDGAMLGHPDSAFHFEFTHERGKRAEAVPSPEHLIVLYLEEAAWHEARERLRAHGVTPVVSHNPYWDRHGVTIEDPDGQRIVLHRGRRQA